jgi:hypothetical protein
MKRGGGNNAASEGYFKRITTAVTGPPPKNYDFKTRVIGGSRSPLCYPITCEIPSIRAEDERVAMVQSTALMCKCGKR